MSISTLTAQGYLCEMLQSQSASESSAWLSGVTLSNMSQFATAYTSAVAGQGSVVAVDLGDSTTLGVGAGTDGGPTTGIALQNGTTRAAEKLSKLLMIPVSRDSFFSQGNVGDGFDPRYTIGTWGPFAGALTVGGPMLHGTGSAANVATMHPTDICDSINVVYFQSPGNGNLIVAKDGTTVRTIVTSGASAGIQVLNIPLTRATGSTYTLTRAANDGDVFFMGVWFDDSVLSRINYICGGSSGAVCSQFIGPDPWNAMATVLAMGAKYANVNFGINEANTGVSTAAFQANMQTLIAALKPSMSVCVEKFNALQISGNITQDLLNQFWAAIVLLAGQNSIPMIDIPALLGQTWIAANAAGYMFDQFHMHRTGYVRKGVGKASVFLKAKQLSGL